MIKLLFLVLISLVGGSLSASKQQIDDFLNVCIDSKHHKSKPGPEPDFFHHCSPWKDNACCKANTTKHIESDGAITLYRMKWDQCSNIKPLSKECRRFLEMDTCFYECSPNMSPWIQVDPNSKKTRRERFVNVPLCASDCDAWFEACKDEYTCSDNWGDIKTWNWTKSGNECKKPCKTFKEYYSDPTTFCNKLFNYSFKYTTGKPGEDCMVMWPNNTRINNSNVARKFAEKALSTSTGFSLSPHFMVLLFPVSLLLN
ncbi:folate receptor gamma-like [Actinia tenebrosa]|uniref:Folate receptor gamma-like n=1 Tax=Actinia tenebrosa TaxID=6105 RepID=A0A6P8IAD4_ACTTE|nr:folate receptor gamma-like [Actinia tenebrosa]